MFFGFSYLASTDLVGLLVDAAVSVYAVDKIMVELLISNGRFSTFCSNSPKILIRKKSELDTIDSNINTETIIARNTVIISLHPISPEPVEERHYFS